MNIEQLHLEVTRNCTLECEHCLRGDRQRINMDPIILDNIFKDIKYVDQLLLTGGEPLIAIQALERLVEILNLKRVKINKILLITNGTVLSDRVLKVLYNLQKNSYLVLKLSTDIFHYLELEKKGLLDTRNKNLEQLHKEKFYNFKEYGPDEVRETTFLLTNKGRTKNLTSERLQEINSMTNSEYMIDVENYFDTGHPRTTLNEGTLEGNITVDVYGNIVSYGLSFEEEDNESYENRFNVIEMQFEEAVKLFINKKNKTKELVIK